MSMSILNNISALTAENNLTATHAALQKTLTELSSGLKINSGSDDAAGLSIANGMNANIAALTQSVQNATNGTGLLQTADGALSQVTTLLNRAVTLATEASTSGITTSQAGALNTEFSNIMSEIDTIGSQTKFNAGTVFVGSGGEGSNNTVNVYMGDGTTGTGMQTQVTIENLSSEKLGLGSSASDTISGSSNASNGAKITVGGTTYTLADAATFATDQTAAAGGTAADANIIQIGGTLADTMKHLANAINGSGTAGVDYTTGTVANTSARASNVSSTGVTITALTSGTAGNSVAESASALSHLAWNNVSSTALATSTLSGTKNFGDGSDAAHTDTITLGSVTYSFAADLSAKTSTATTVYVKQGATLAASLTNLQAAVMNSGTAGRGAGANYAGITDGTVALASANADVTAAAPSTTGLTSSITFTANGATTAADKGLGGEAVVATDVLGTSSTSDVAFGNASGTLNNALSGGTGTALDLNNTTDAQAALAAINTAISTVASMRGTIGATVNQLQAATNVMNNQVQNLTSAASGITDADIGTTVANMSKYNTLSSTGIAALQQANQASQSVLKLLQ